MESIQQSIYQSDFRAFDSREILKTTLNKPKPVPVPKSSKISKSRPIQMDLEILQPFKTDVNVPFSLFHEKKCILHTSPHDPIPEVKLEEKLFDQKLEARRRRRTVYMTPQINLDKIPEDIMYGENKTTGLVSSIYSSDWKKAYQFAAKNSSLKHKDDPMKRKFVKSDLTDKSIEKIRFKAKSIVPPMEVGLEKYVPIWNKEYPVEYVNTTKLFWEKNKELGRCNVCESQHSEQGLTDAEKTELDNCLKEDELRTPYTLHPPGYTGYVPRLAPGIQFRRKKFTKYDPFVTSLMTLQGAYDKNSI